MYLACVLADHLICSPDLGESLPPVCALIRVLHFTQHCNLLAFVDLCDLLKPAVFCFYTTWGHQIKNCQSFCDSWHTDIISGKRHHIDWESVILRYHLKLMWKKTWTACWELKHHHATMRLGNGCSIAGSCTIWTRYCLTNLYAGIRLNCTEWKYR